METVSVNKFRDNLKKLVEQSVSRHEPLRVSRRSGQDFVDFQRHTGRNHTSRIPPINTERKGYTPTKEQMDEITGI